LFHGYLFNGSTYTTVDDPLGAQGTSAAGISGNNIVGSYTGPLGVLHGFLGQTSQPGQGTGTIIDVPPAILSGSVYVDINNDGIREATEVGIANVPITATLAGTNISQTVRTQADGTFMFVGLLPGTYTLTETQPGFYVDGKDTHNGVVSPTNDQFSGIMLAPSQTAGGYNFGEMGLRPEFTAAFFNRRAFFSTAVVTGEEGPPANATALNLQGGDVWISFDGGWQGQRTIQATFNPALGSVTMALYDINLHQLALSTPTGTGAQLTFTGTGVTYFLKVTGTNTNVSLSINDPTLGVNFTQPQGITTAVSSTQTAPSTGVTTTFASSATPAASAVQPMVSSVSEPQDATDAALADEDDWLSRLLAA
jgi:hypothetical protein